MGQERCEMCDRATCPTLTMPEMPSPKYDLAGDMLYIESDAKVYLTRLAATNDCEAHAVDWRRRALDAEAKLSRYERHDIALGDIHILCADAGVPEGNVVERVAKLKDRLLEAEARERWVSVEERLPEVGQRVLVWRKGIGGAYESEYADFGFRHSRDVSHWRPMPAAPEVRS